MWACCLQHYAKLNIEQACMSYFKRLTHTLNHAF